jgi:hypothetical protein
MPQFRKRGFAFSLSRERVSVPVKESFERFTEGGEIKAGDSTNRAMRRENDHAGILQSKERDQDFLVRSGCGLLRDGSAGAALIPIGQRCFVPVMAVGNEQLFVRQSCAESLHLRGIAHAPKTVSHSELIC